MLDLKSNKTLGIIFAVLLVIVVLIFITGGNKGDRSFRKDLVSIDTTIVSEFDIYPKSKPGTELKIFKDEDDNDIWKVVLENGKTAPVPKSKITNLFNTLLAVKPLRLAARDKSKWDEFQVDDKATRVRVLENGYEALNLIIGKFSFQQPRQMNTFVRLAHNDDVYEVEGFLEMTFNQGANSFRDNYILNENQSDWKSLDFQYPADSSFTMFNVNGIWSIDGKAADSTAAANYLRTLARLSNSNFVDEGTDNLSNPIYKLTIEKTDSTFRTISAFAADSTLIIHSSQNPTSYFDGNKGDLKGKIFVGKNKFIK